MLRSLLATSLTLLLGLPVVADELFPAVPAGEVMIRTVPGNNAVEYEATTSLENGWQRGFERGAIYAAYARSSLNTPGIVTFPDWESQPEARGSQVHLLVATLLDASADLPIPKEERLTLVPQPEMTVACYAQTGPYTAANFLLGLAKIQAFLKVRGVPVTGPPRYVFFNNTAWWPSWWQVGEVEVPVPSGAGR